MALQHSDRSRGDGALRLAHLVNVFRPRPGSEFEWAQPITLETMRRAAAQAQAAGITVDLLTAQLPEDRALVTAPFLPTPDLSRTVRDVLGNADLPPLPLIADLLQRLHDGSDADWLIYTNIDIALQPDFYARVADCIAAGHDAFIINRRRIPGHYRHVSELPQMYAERGLPHPGFDCFVFHRSLFPRFDLDTVCIGIPFIEILLGQNLFCHAERFRLYADEYWTFHIGEEVFKARHAGLLQANKEAAWRALRRLMPLLDSRKFPWGDRWLGERLVRWGLHPCIPIRLCLLLEWRRLWRRRK